MRNLKKGEGLRGKVIKRRMEKRNKRKSMTI